MNRRLKLMRWYSLVALLAVMLTAPAAAQNGTRGAQVEPLPLPERSMMEIARSEGTVPVIIQLAAPYRDESSLSAAAVASQRATLDATRSAILRGLARHAPEVRANSTEWTIPFIALDLTPDALLELQQSPYVVNIMLDEPSPPLLYTALPAQDVPQAHLGGYTGAGTVVAVLDTGVYKNHEFLTGKVIAEACFSRNQPSINAVSLCPNGKNVQKGDGAADPSKCEDISDCRHGTHVAGIVAGNPLDPASLAGTDVISGVAPGARIYAIQVFQRVTNYYYCGLQPCLLSFKSDQVAALQQVYADRALYNIAAVNISIGGRLYKKACDSAEPALTAAITALYNVGIATVVASGNNGSLKKVTTPGCISKAITVGSVTDVGQVSSFTNSNKLLDLWGVGASIVSSWSSPGGYMYLNGTSMAAPMVAGAWAVIKSIRPSASVPEVLQIFNDTGYTITDVNNVTRDLIQVGDAAVLAAGLPAPSNLLADGNFEGAAVLRVSAWKKKGSSATVSCDALNMYGGFCYGQLAQGKGKLIQKVNGAFAKKDQITLSAYIKAVGATKGKVQLTVTYKNGSTAKIKFTVKGTTAYTLRTASLTLKKNAKSFKVTIVSPKNGTFYVDNISVTVD